MTSKIKAAVMAGTAALAVSFGATGANAATGTGDAVARILKQITVTEGGDLNFGTILPSITAGGTVVVDSASNLTCDPALTCLSTTQSAGDFDIEASPNEVLDVSVDASATLTHTVDGVTTMSVSALNTSSPTVTMDAAGEGSFTVGGTLTVGINQLDGLYAGTYDVQVDYQ